MKIIIIGGGFAGLDLARSLKNKKGFDILLIDKVSYHQFQPLFYQVATASLEPSNISFPLRKVFQKSKNVRIRITEVLKINKDANQIETETGTYPYDVLVLATGATTNFFGNEKMASLAFPMKSTLEALQLMNRVINNFEDALDTTDEEERKKIMSVTIVGAGPTGVELAGALAEMKTRILPKDYPELNLENMNIYLVDHNQPLAVMSEQSSADAKRYLEEMGVILHMGIGVKDFDGEKVMLSDGGILETKTVIWAAGVIGNVPEGIQPELVVRGNRIKTDRFHKVETTANIYAIGDIAYMETPAYPHGHPQLASVAKSQAKHLAKNLIRAQSGKPVEEYEFSDKGTMATVGKRKAVVDIPSPHLHLKGRLAWLIWMFLHLMLILGVKNRLQIFINWAYKYITFDTSLRLVNRHLGRLSSIELQKIKPAVKP